MYYLLYTDEDDFFHLNYIYYTVDVAKKKSIIHGSYIAVLFIRIL